MCTSSHSMKTWSNFYKTVILEVIFEPSCLCSFTLERRNKNSPVFINSELHLMNIHVTYNYDYLRGPKWAKVALLSLFTVVIQSKMFLVCAQLIFVHNFMFQTCFLFLHS